MHGGGARVLPRARLRFHAMLDPAVHAKLAAILPPSALLTAPEDTRPYECDGLTLYRAVPAAVAIPENEAQVVAILRRCHEARVPVVVELAGPRFLEGLGNSTTATANLFLYAFDKNNQVVDHLTQKIALDLTKAAEPLRKAGIRVETDLRNEKINYKIREHSMQKLPYLIVVGDKEKQNGAVAVRARGNQDLGVLSLEDFMARVSNDIALKV